MVQSLPKYGQASTYSDFFVNKRTSNGDIYTHDGYTAALLPKERWHVVPLGTLLKLKYQSRSVVVKVNDRGAGDGTLDRVLDLSRAAYAYLIGKSPKLVTDQNAGLIQLAQIQIVPASTTVGPVL